MNLFYKIIAKLYDLIDIIYFRNYDKSPRKAVLDTIADHDKILDLCTGTGTNAINIAREKRGATIVGVDLSENMLKVAKSKVRKSDIKNIRLHQMDAVNLKFEDNCFDKILISLVLHELDEELADKVLREVKRVLKADGEIVITEWEISKKFSQRLLFSPIHFLEPKPYRAFVKRDLYSYFKKYGLDIQTITHCDYTKVIILKKNILIQSEAQL